VTNPLARAAVVLAVVAVALVVRVLGWGNWSLWLDEAVVLDWARRGLFGFRDAVVSDGNHPPGHFLVVFVVRRISESDFSLRLPSALFGAGTALALFARCGGFRRPRAALGAALAFALLPIAVHYGQEVKPYSMALFFVALSDAARDRWRVTRGRTALVVWTSAAAAAVWTLYFAVLALGAIFAVELLGAWRARKEDPRRLRTAAVVPVVVLLSFVPWLWAIRGGVAQANTKSGPRVTAGAVWSQLVGLAAGRDENLGRQAAAIAVWLIALAGSVCADREERARIVAESCASTLLVLTALSLADHWWEVRYIVLGTLPLARAIGEALEGAGRIAWNPLRRGATAAIAVVFVAVQIPALAQNAASGRVDWRVVVHGLEGEAGRGAGGTILAADSWALYCLRAQTLRRPEPRLHVEMAGSAAALRSAIATRREGWIVRTPHHGVEKEIDALLAGTRPWSWFPQVDGARLYRFELGRLVEP
jgi:4-amino-4-deoxy-L-arabinose transferase-like glycosyltransferase